MGKQETTKNQQDPNKSGFEHPDLYMGETGASVSLTSFMTAVVVFFIGLLITGSPDLQVRLRIPLLFLFLSGLGFLYSTLIYANASGEVARLRQNEFRKQMSSGNITSEFLGVYCLVFAIPIIVGNVAIPDTIAIISTNTTLTPVFGILTVASRCGLYSDPLALFRT
jgi:hypothetical protein